MTTIREKFANRRVQPPPKKRENIIKKRSSSNTIDTRLISLIKLQNFHSKFTIRNLRSKFIIRENVI